MMPAIQGQLAMIAKVLRSAGLALLLVPALLSSAPTPAAAALEFQCIEASRYKNLLQIFHDDPSTFFSYFNISRRPLPSPEACRALLVTGTIAPDSADALLGRVIEGRGWLAALYLSFSRHEPRAGGGDGDDRPPLLAEDLRSARAALFLSIPTLSCAGRRPIGKGGFLTGGRQRRSVAAR